MCAGAALFISKFLADDQVATFVIRIDVLEMRPPLLCGRTSLLTIKDAWSSYFANFSVNKCGLIEHP